MSVVGWILQAQGVQTIPARYFVVAATAIFLWASLQAFHDVRLQRDRFAEDRKPKLDIVYLPDNETESRPYVQMLRVQMPWKLETPIPTQIVVDMLDRRFRVGVVTLGAAAVERVSLTLESCTPSGNFIHLGHRLLVMDTDPPESERDVPPTDAEHPAVFFDVVNAWGREADMPDAFKFCYANPNIVGPVDSGAYSIVLRADGGGTSVRRSFRVLMNQATDGDLVMRPL